MTHYTWAGISARMEELYESLRSRDSVRSVACDEYARLRSGVS